MNALDNGAFLYSKSCIATKGYHYEKWLLKCNYDRKVLVKRKILKYSNEYRKGYIENDKIMVIGRVE